MTRDILASVSALILILSLVGCQAASPSGDDSLPQPAVNWGITLSTEDVSATGLTLVITQTGGEPTGTLEYGSQYNLEVLKNGVWEPVPYIDDTNWGWTSVAHSVHMESTANLSLGWEPMHGSLPAGTYRIGKEFMDFRSPGDYDVEMFYTMFEIK